MAFPTSPANNQTALVNGIVYQWNEGLEVWKRNGSVNSIAVGQALLNSEVPSTSNTTGTLVVVGGVGVSGNVYADSVYITSSKGITFSDGSTQTTGSVGLDQSARDIANAAFSQAVTAYDLAETANTNVVSVDIKAQAAFDSANTKLSLSGGIIAGNITANTLTANVAVISPELSSPGGTTHVYTSDIGIVAINVGGGETKFYNSSIEVPGDLLGGSYGGNRVSLTGYDTKLQSLRSSSVKIETGSDGTVSNNWIFSGATLYFPDGTTQNTAFDSTTFSPFDTYARTTANAAFDKANAAYELANTANTTASSGGSGGGSTSFTSVVDTFTGNGSQTEFTLSVVPDSETSTFVYLNGVYQNKSTYSLAGANIIFTGTATANDTIEVTTVAGSVMNVSPSGYSTRIYQGNGSTNTFTVTAGQTANTVMVFNNGICQFPGDDYTISGTTLTFVLTPYSDEVVQIREMPINQLVALTQPNMRRYTANGVQTTFTVTSGQSANSMFVFENGVCQVPVNDYTVSGTTLTFTTAPTVDKVIQIREMPV